MAKLSRVCEGMKVLARYGDGDLSAAHDVLYATTPGLAPDTMAPADMARLEELGWYWDTSYECWAVCT